MPLFWNFLRLVIVHGLKNKSTLAPWQDHIGQTEWVVDKVLTPGPWTTPMANRKMDFPWKIPFRMSTIQRTAIYIPTVHLPCLFSSARPLGAILNNYTQWTTAEHRKKYTHTARPLLSFRSAYYNTWNLGKNFILKICFVLSKIWMIFMRITFVTYEEKAR